MNLPTVSLFQWILLGASLMLSALGVFAADYDDLLVLLCVLAALSTLLLANLAKEALYTRLLGKFFLAFSVMIFFWLEALGQGFQSPSFTVTGGPAQLWGQFNRAAIARAFIYIAMFQIALFAGYSIRPRANGLFHWLASRHDNPRPAHRALRYLLASCVFIPLLLAYKLDLPAALDGLLAARSGDGPEVQEVGFYHYLYFIGMYGAALFLVESLFARSARLLVTVTIALLTSLPFILSGTRHLWLYIALPACVAWVRSYQGKITLARLLGAGVVAIVVVGIMQAQLLLRDVGWTSMERANGTGTIATGATGQFTALLFADYLVPEVHDYFKEPAEPYFVIHWIPRRFWPDKPIMRSWSYYNDMYTQGGAFNVTPSVIGQFHMNWGFAGVVYIGLLLGFLTTIADRAMTVLELSHQRSMIVAIGMLYAFIVCSFRFYSPVYFTYFVFTVFGMLLTTRTMLWRTSTVTDDVAGGIAVEN